MKTHVFLVTTDGVVHGVRTDLHSPFLVSFASLRLCLLMSSANLSQEDSLIDLKRELDILGFDRNNPSTFASGQPDVRRRALTLVESYLENFSDCGIALLYKRHLHADTCSGKGKVAGDRSQPSITSFFSKRQKTDHPSSSTAGVHVVEIPQMVAENEVTVPSVVTSTDDAFERDPGLRDLIQTQSVSREKIIDRYVQLGPFQPRLAKYPADSKTGRCFTSGWFQRFPWLEYSIAHDGAFCFPCYLFSRSKHTAGSNSQFISGGFRRWKSALEKNKGLVQHNNSIEHKNAVAVMEQRKAKILPQMLSGLNAEQQSGNAAQTVATAKVVLHLALQGLAFRGHDESSESLNRGNFLETLSFLVQNNPDLQKSMEVLPRNAKYTSPEVQKEMTRAAADIVRQKIRKELGDSYYCVVVDEARCEAKKEWMSVVLRFVDKEWSDSRKVCRSSSC
ncbi:MAG: DUF4371 domain-containing protein [Nitrososphaerales archaeon]